MNRKLIVLMLVGSIILSLCAGYLLGVDYPQLAESYLTWGDYREGYYDALSKNEGYIDGFHKGYEEGVSVTQDKYHPANITINTNPVVDMPAWENQTAIIIKQDQNEPVFNLDGSGMFTMVDTNVFVIALNENEVVDFYAVTDDDGRQYFEVKNIGITRPK